MDWCRHFLYIFILSGLKLTYANVFDDVMKSRNECKEICDNSQLRLPTTKHVKQICQRGCRFFNIAHKDGMFINETKEDCHSSCMESYSRTKDRYACSIGCDSMARQKQSDASFDNWLLYIEQDGQDNMVVIQPDLELDNDLLLADPGLRSQVEWSYGVQYKIPETHIRTMPIGDSHNFDIPSDFDDNLKDVRVGHGDWLDCASRNSGLPRWLLATAIVVAVLVALWLCLTPEKRTALDLPHPLLINDVQFTPPPKYSLTSDKV